MIHHHANVFTGSDFIFKYIHTLGHASCIIIMMAKCHRHNSIILLEFCSRVQNIPNRGTRNSKGGTVSLQWLL